jgi:hypothetical protein
MVGAGLERFTDVIRLEHGRATRSEMRERGLERRAQVRLGRHVADRVVDQHGIERPPEAERTHVADVVLGVGIDRRAELENPR